jgi:hypothetical protein
MMKLGDRSEESALTEVHFRLFGAIVHSFAQYELAIQRGLAGVLGVEVIVAAMLTRGVDFVQKRAAFPDLLRERQMPSDIWDNVFAHLAVPTCRVQVRDEIIHATWKPSLEPHSIQPNWILRIPPGIEPAYGSPNSESTSYSLELLNEIETELTEGYERFVDYLVTSGLIRLRESSASQAL